MPTAKTSACDEMFVHSSVQPPNMWSRRWTVARLWSMERLPVREQSWIGGISGVHFLGSVLILTMRPTRTWALTTQRPPQLWPHVLVTTVSPGFGATRGDS